jgi:hypothetical protein
VITAPENRRDTGSHGAAAATAVTVTVTVTGTPPRQAGLRQRRRDRIGRDPTSLTPVTVQRLSESRSRSRSPAFTLAGECSCYTFRLEYKAESEDSTWGGSEAAGARASESGWPGEMLKL